MRHLVAAALFFFAGDICGAEDFSLGDQMAIDRLERDADHLSQQFRDASELQANTIQELRQAMLVMNKQRADDVERMSRQQTEHIENNALGVHRAFEAERRTTDFLMGAVIALSALLALLIVFLVMLGIGIYRAKLAVAELRKVISLISAQIGKQPMPSGQAAA